MVSVSNTGWVGVLDGGTGTPTCTIGEYGFKKTVSPKQY